VSILSHPPQGDPEAAWEALQASLEEPSGQQFPDADVLPVPQEGGAQ
jgi:hypothetical protein